MPHLLVLVPLKSRHIARLHEVLGPKWVIDQYPVKDESTPNAISFGGTALSDEELFAALLQADAVIGEPAPAILRRAVDAGSPVRLIQMTWAGADKYTRSTVAFPADVTLCTAVGTFGQSISQYALAQVLSLMFNLPRYRDQQREASWQDLGAVGSLDGARVLIFGTGNIGGCVALRLRGFDAHITGVCRNTTRAREGFDALVTLDGAEAALQEADAVVCALPNTPETAGWLDKRRLELMKPDAVLVNVGRGNFVDCDALAEVLAAGHLRGAALDVTSPEPLPAGHPLWQEPRCVITPHVAGGSLGRNPQTEDNLCAICCRNLQALVSGGQFINRMPESAFDVMPA